METAHIGTETAETLDAIQARRQRLANIERDAEALRDMNRDLLAMLGQQDDPIAHISASTAQASGHTDEAVADLDASARFMQRARWVTTVAGGGALGTLVGGPVGLYMGAKAGVLVAATVLVAVGVIRNAASSSALADDPDHTPDDASATST